MINKEAKLSEHFSLGELTKTKHVTPDGNIPSGVVVENLKRLRVLAAFRRETTGKPPQGWFSESLKRKNPRSLLGGDSCYCSHNGVCPRCEIGCGMRLSSASLQSLRNSSNQSHIDYHSYPTASYPFEEFL